MVATPAAQTAWKANAAIEAAELDGSASTTVAQDSDERQLLWRGEFHRTGAEEMQASQVVICPVETVSLVSSVLIIWMKACWLRTWVQLHTAKHYWNVQAPWNKDVSIIVFVHFWKWSVHKQQHLPTLETERVNSWLYVTHWLLRLLKLTGRKMKQRVECGTGMRNFISHHKQFNNHYVKFFYT